MDSHVSRAFNPGEIARSPKRSLTRRDLLRLGASGFAASTLATIATAAWVPQRAHAAAPFQMWPDIQFDISSFIAPALTIEGVRVRFGPVFTLFTPARLTRTPTLQDWQVFSAALNTIERMYRFGPGGVFLFLSYGIPYFKRLPGGMTGRLVSNFLPRLLADPSRFALEEAVAGPTDYPSANKQTFKVPLTIEANDMLLTLRSDHLPHVTDIVNWLKGSNRLNRLPIPSPAFQGLFAFEPSRLMFQQIGLPRQIADTYTLPFRARVNPRSPMWMGFGDQQVSASGPAEITTFQGNPSARFTTTTGGDYFYNGSIQHLSHVIQDLNQFYAAEEPYQEHIQYMFRSDPLPSRGYTDQYTNGGGPAFLPNDATVFLHYKASGQEEASATGADPNVVNDPQTPGNPTTVEPRMGHVAALQQSSRAPDGTPIHIRMDGTGFDGMDVPDGSNQPKLQFTVFVPTAQFFTDMRTNQAALKYQKNPTDPNSKGVDPDDNGLERFLTATRRQNFLVPPRTHRVFPLIEFTWPNP
jgi:hypothetical protein